MPAKPILYDHGLNVKLAATFLGKSTKTEADDDGLWIEAELDRHGAYMEQVRHLLDAGVLGWSSGSVGHLVRRENGLIKSWPIVEFSLTPTPAEPRTLGVNVLKALAEVDATYSALLPEATAVAVQDADGVDAEATKSSASIPMEEPMPNTAVPMDTQDTAAVIPSPTTPDVATLMEQAAAKAVAAFAAAQTPDQRCTRGRACGRQEARRYRNLVLGRVPAHRRRWRYQASARHGRRGLFNQGIE